jgi:hypothetical protein
MKRKIFWAVALLAILSITAAAPLVQAQTKAQQQELEQIGKRSPDGKLSPQDRARAIQIFTDIYVDQGLTKQQAASFAEMSVNAMFTGLTQDQQQQANDARKGFEQAQEQQRQNELAEQQRQKQEEERQRQERTKATAILKKWGLQNVQLPAGTIRAEGDSISIDGSNSPTAIKERQVQYQDLKGQIEKIIGRKMDKRDGSDNDFLGLLGKNKYVEISITDTHISIYCWQGGAGGK